MISTTTDRFWKYYAGLPDHIREQARAAYKRFADDPNHPGLRFKPVHPTEPLFSVRVGSGYRALGLVEGDEITWVWIGTHADYDRFIAEF